MQRPLTINERRSLAAYRGWTTKKHGKPDTAPAADRGKHPELLAYVSQIAPDRFIKIIRKLGRMA